MPFSPDPIPVPISTRNRANGAQLASAVLSILMTMVCIAVIVAGTILNP